MTICGTYYSHILWPQALKPTLSPYCKTEFKLSTWQDLIKYFDNQTLENVKCSRLCVLAAESYCSLVLLGSGTDCQAHFIASTPNKMSSRVETAWPIALQLSCSHPIKSPNFGMSDLSAYWSEEAKTFLSRFQNGMTLSGKKIRPVHYVLAGEKI